VPEARLPSTLGLAYSFTNAASTFAGTVTGRVTGPVVLGNVATCSAGAVRWDGSHFQGCNGTDWLNLDNVPPPIISSVTPAWGTTDGGTALTITGSNFQALATVYLSGTALSGATVDSTTRIRVTTPANGTAGARDVKVQNPDFLSGTLASGFTYARPPTISGISPNEGPTPGNWSVTISGTDFTSTPTVTFAGASAPVTSLSTTQLVVTLPAGTAGAATVTVQNPAPYNLSTSSTFTYRVPGTTAGVALQSCRAVKTGGYSTGSGAYWVNPNGTGAFEIYCDMTGDDGGWTLVAGIAPDNNHDTSAAVTPANLVAVSGKGKLSDAVINALRTAPGSEGIVRLNCTSSVDFYDYRSKAWHADYVGYPNGVGWDVYTQPWGTAPYTTGGQDYPNQPGCWAYSTWGTKTIYGYSGWTGCYDGTNVNSNGTTWIR